MLFSLFIQEAYELMKKSDQFGLLLFCACNILSLMKTDEIEKPKRRMA